MDSLAHQDCLDHLDSPVSPAPLDCRATLVSLDLKESEVHKDSPVVRVRQDFLALPDPLGRLDCRDPAAFQVRFRLLINCPAFGAQQMTAILEILLFRRTWRTRPSRSYRTKRNTRSTWN